MEIFLRRKYAPVNTLIVSVREDETRHEPARRVIR
jgi:hypothetical protein